MYKKIFFILVLLFLPSVYAYSSTDFFVNYQVNKKDLTVFDLNVTLNNPTPSDITINDLSKLKTRYVNALGKDVNKIEVRLWKNITHSVTRYNIASICNPVKTWNCTETITGSYTQTWTNEKSMPLQFPLTLKKGQTVKLNLIAYRQPSLGKTANDIFIGLNVDGTVYERPDWVWWNVSWNYKKPITINASTDRIDYQLRLNVTDLTNMVSDCSDVRFVDSTETSELPYWREDYSYGSWCSFYFKGNWSSGSSIKVYIYYGNTTPVTTTSSGTNTFIFFDDFESGNLNLWTTTTGCSAVTSPIFGGTYSAKIAGNGLMKTVTVGKIGYMLNISATGVGNDGWSGSINTNYFLVGYAGVTSATNLTAVHNALGSYEATTGILGNFWGSIVLVTNNSVTRAYQNDALIYSRATNTTFDNIKFYRPSGTNIFYVDNVFGAKFENPEPTTSIGSEESDAETQTYITVCASGCNSTTIQGGINLAGTSGLDKVIITDSIQYNESVIMNVTGLTLTSTASPYINVTRISGCASPKYAINVTADNSIVDNITVVFGCDGSSVKNGAIRINADNVIVNRTNVTSIKSRSMGIMFETGVNATITYNNLSSPLANMIDTFGIDIKSYNATVKGNTMTEPYANGLIFEGYRSTVCSNHVIDNTNVVDGYPLYYLSSSNNSYVLKDEFVGQINVICANNITLRNITLNGSDSVMFVFSNNSILEYSNLINTTGEQVYLSGDNYNITIANNNMSTIFTYATVIMVTETTHGTLIENNTITMYSGYPLIMLINAYNTTIRNSVLTSLGSTFCSGIRILSSSENTTIYNVNITNVCTDTTYGAVRIGDSINTYMSSMNITATKFAISIDAATDNFIKDSWITSSTNQLLKISSGNITSINNTYLTSNNITLTGGSAFIGWNLNISESNGLDDVLVTGYDNNNVSEFSGYTDSTGILSIDAWELLKNTTGIFYFSNYTITASKDGYLDNSSIINMTSSKSISITMTSSGGTTTTTTITTTSTTITTTSTSTTTTTLYQVNTTSCAGDWSATHTCALTYDNNWNTYGSPYHSSATVYENFTMPAVNMDNLFNVSWTAKFSSSYGGGSCDSSVTYNITCFNTTNWYEVLNNQGCNGGGTITSTLPLSCYNQSVLQMRTILVPGPYSDYDTYLYFEGGASWNILTYLYNEQYLNNSIEGNLEFSAYARIPNDSYTIISYLVWNNTHYAATSSPVSPGVYYISKTINSRIVELNTSVLWYWNILVYSGSSVVENYTSTTRNQTLNKIYIGNCVDGISEQQTLSLSVFDESTFVLINATVDISFSVTADGYTYENYTFSYINTTKGFCIYPTWAAYMGNVNIKYNSSGYDPRYYFLYPTLTNATQNLNLYLLSSTLSYVATISVYNTNGIPYENAFVDVQRYYPETLSYISTTQVQTDYEGKATAYIIPNTVYYRFVVKDPSGNALKQFTSKIITCNPSDYTCPPYKIDLYLADAPTFIWMSYYDATFTCSNTTLLLSCTVIYSNNAMSNTSLIVQNSTGSTICSSSAFTSSATLVCNLGNTTGQTYFYWLQVYYNNKWSVLTQGVLSFPSPLQIELTWGEWGIYLFITLNLVFFMIGNWMPYVSNILAMILNYVLFNTVILNISTEAFVSFESIQLFVMFIQSKIRR